MTRESTSHREVEKTDQQDINSESTELDTQPAKDTAATVNCYC